MVEASATSGADRQSARDPRGRSVSATSRRSAATCRKLLPSTDWPAVAIAVRQLIRGQNCAECHGPFGQLPDAAISEGACRSRCATCAIPRS